MDRLIVSDFSAQCVTDKATMTTLVHIPLYTAKCFCREMSGSEGVSFVVVFFST